jgi:hypothetical protein
MTGEHDAPIFRHISCDLALSLQANVFPVVGKGKKASKCVGMRRLDPEPPALPFPSPNPREPRLISINEILSDDNMPRRYYHYQDITIPSSLKGMLWADGLSAYGV